MHFTLPESLPNPTRLPIRPLYGMENRDAQAMRERMRWELFDAEYFIFLYRPRDEAIVKSFVPPPLKLLPKSPLVSIFIQQLNVNDGRGNDGPNAGYHEHILSAMVTHEGTMGMWALAIQIETDMGAMLGREMFGTAKKIGRFTYEKQDGRFSWQVERRGITIAEAGGEILAGAADPANVLKLVEFPTYHLHQVVGPFHGDAYAYPPRLMRMRPGVRKIHEFRTCDNVSLRFNESPFDPICLLAPREIQAVSYLRADTAIEHVETISELNPEAMLPFLFSKLDPF